MKKNIDKLKRIKKDRRHGRVRAKVSGDSKKLRFSVFRANRHIYGQLIDDVLGKTLVSASSLEVKTKGKKIDVAKEVGKLVAQKATLKKIKKVVFDRGGNAYHGRVKALAEGAREAGLEF